jgi:hypothetical protein
MTFRKLFLLAAISALLWPPLALAQESSKQEFQQALLSVQKAHIVTGIYQAVFLEPERCASTMGKNYSDLADEFRRTYPELIALVERSELLPPIKKSLDSANASPPTMKTLFDECPRVAAMLLQFTRGEGGKEQIQQMIQTLKQ